MPIVDAHVHLYPPELNANPEGWASAHGEIHWTVLCLRRRRDGRLVQTLPSVDELLRAMDVAGVNRAVLQGWYWERPDTCAWQNRFYAECVRAHPDRLSAFATLHPKIGLKEVLAEVRSAKEAGFVGLGELSPHSQGYAVDDPAFLAVLALAGDLGLPVNFHVTDPDAGNYPGKVATPLADFARLAREFPRTNFILAHWGALLPLRQPEARELNNVFYDTAASPLLYRDGSVWTRFVSEVGAARVLFGSDYPLNLYPALDAKPGFARLLAEVKGSGLGEHEQEQVLQGTADALRLF